MSSIFFRGEAELSNGYATSPGKSLGLIDRTVSLWPEGPGGFQKIPIMKSYVYASGGGKVIQHHSTGS